MRLESPPRLKTQFTEPRNRPRDLAMLLLSIQRLTKSCAAGSGVDSIAQPCLMDQGLPPPPFSVPSMGVGSGLESPTMPAAGLMQSVGLVPPGAPLLSRSRLRTKVACGSVASRTPRPPRTLLEPRLDRSPH